MSQGRITLGFKPEVLEQVRGVRRPLVSAVLLRSLGVLAGLIIVGTALVLTTDIEELLYPRTIILRGNRLSAAAEVLEVSNMPQAINSAILLPFSGLPASFRNSISCEMTYSGMRELTSPASSMNRVDIPCLRASHVR